MKIIDKSKLISAVIALIIIATIVYFCSVGIKHNRSMQSPDTEAGP
jgi:large-conductance mechanosensitive channel